MKKHKTAKKKSSKNKRSKRKISKISKRPRTIEWVGGRFLAPFYIDEDPPFHPLIELWIELPSQLVVYVEIHEHIEDLPAVTDALRQTLRKPESGIRPHRLRVNDALWAAEIDKLLPNHQVVLGQTRELDAVVDDLISSMAQGEEQTSFLANGTLSADSMEALFKAAAALFRIAPWQYVFDEQLIEVDIPVLDVHGACLSIIGSLGESLGFILFASLYDYERMVEFSHALDEGTESVDIGCKFISLNYELGANLPSAKRREAHRHHWPVAAASAYPIVEYRDDSGFPRDPTARELSIITACSEALVSVFEDYEKTSTDEFQFFSLSHVCANGLEIHLKAPPTSLMSFNDLASHSEEMDPHQLDHLLGGHMLEYAYVCWGPGFLRRIERMMREDAEIQILLPFALYHLAVEEGKTVATCFLEAHQNSLNDRQRQWLTAQRAAWFSLWEVVAVVPGESIQLRDLLSDEVCVVQDKLASESARVRSVLLGRVVHDNGMDLLAGCHPKSLPPLAAADVVERMRKYLRKRTDIPKERLRGANTARYLIKRWQEKVQEQIETSTRLPELINFDGDAIVETIDRYKFEQPSRAKIEARLLEMDGIKSESPGEYVIIKNAQERDTVIGWIRIHDDTLRVESNSVERADALRAELEHLCANLIVHRGRSHEAVYATMNQMRSPPQADNEISSEQLELFVAEHKQQYYERWLDIPIPALDNKSPREAILTIAGKEKVKVLIDEIEYREASQPAGERFDTSTLKRALRL